MTSVSVVGLIPARGGSKSIPDKNISPVAGKPLIAWTIECARSCSCLQRVIVSTDSSEIADVARQYGGEVPFMRPTELARDDTAGIEPVLHALRWLDQYEDYRPDYVMVLQSTSPLRAARDIKTCLDLALRREADAIVSVCPVEHHPYWMKRIMDDGRLADFLSLDRLYTRRQDLPPVYALNGAIYLARRGLLLEQKTFYTDRTYAYLMPEERSIDIDTPWNLHLADLILQERKCDEGD